MKHRFSELPRGKWCALLLGLVLMTEAAGRSQTQETMIRRSGNLTPAVARAVQMDRIGADENIRFSISLPLRDQAGAEKLAKSIYMPGDPLYGHYLKKGEFADRFGATQADYDAVIDFVKQRGLTVVGTHSNRLLLEAGGTADKVEKAFNVHLMHFRSANGRIFHAPDAEPSLPSSISAKIAGIVGLDDALQPHSNLMPAPSGQPGFSSGIGSGFQGGLIPSDIRAAYGLNTVTENGTGQTLAIFTADGYLASDITAYENTYGLPHIMVTNVLIDGATGVPSSPSGNGPIESTLDIELSMALATNLEKIVVYIVTNYVPDYPNGYTRIADDDTAQQVTTSWSEGRDIDLPASLINAEYGAFLQMANQGQTVYAASGDFGSEVETGTDSMGNPILAFGVQNPASQPYVTGVGGTTLATQGPGGAYGVESVWSGSRGSTSVGSGGGISPLWPLPEYQSQTVSSGSGGSASHRNVPDVCLNADYPGSPYAIFHGGQLTEGGTSCAAPLWASFTAMVNQRRASHNEVPVGFLNPALYLLARSPSYTNDFHDITSGNNGTYTAVSNYDNCTGWGSFNGANLINDLQSTTAILYVNGAYNGIQLGTATYPFRTVGSAEDAASASGPTVFFIRGGDYSETLTVSKPVVMRNNGGGDVTIGH